MSDNWKNNTGYLDERGAPHVWDGPSQRWVKANPGALSFPADSAYVMWCEFRALQAEVAALRERMDNQVGKWDE